MNPPVLAVTLGDPAGVGPEIALKAVAALQPRLEAGEMALVLVGDAGALAEAGRQVGLPVPPTVDRLDDLRGAVLLPTEPPAQPIRTAEVSAEAGEQAYRAVALAT